MIYSGIVLGILAVILCLFFYDYWKQATTVTLNDIRSDTGINFPKNSTVANVSLLRTLDPEWVAEVVVTAQTGKSLMQSLDTRPNSTINVTKHQSVSVPWLNPKNVVYTKFYEQNNFLVDVIVSQEGND